MTAILGWNFSRETRRLIFAVNEFYGIPTEKKVQVLEGKHINLGEIRLDPVIFIGSNIGPVFKQRFRPKCSITEYEKHRPFWCGKISHLPHRLPYQNLL